MKDDLTLGGGHTMQYTDHVSLKCILETYMILLTNYHPNKFNKKNIKKGGNKLSFKVIQ